jgi:hypothetical protein
LGFQRTATGAIFDGLGEMNFGWKGRKEVYILRRREMVKTRFPSGALDSEIQQVCRTSLFWVEIRALTLQVCSVMVM